MATAKPSGSSNKNSKARNTSGSISTRSQVEQTQSQVKSQTSSTARQAEAQVDDTADAAKDAAQDTKCATALLCRICCTSCLELAAAGLVRAQPAVHPTGALVFVAYTLACRPSAPCRRQTRRTAAETKRNISGASEDVKEGVDQVADAVADTAEQAQEGLDDASGTDLHALLAHRYLSWLTSDLRLHPHPMHKLAARTMHCVLSILMVCVLQRICSRASTRPARSCSKPLRRRQRWQQTSSSR